MYSQIQILKMDINTSSLIIFFVSKLIATNHFDYTNVSIIIVNNMKILILLRV